MTQEAPGTKERILDAAERLFAERGFAATSLRAITAAAQVNLAAVNYHFHSKEALLQAVYARRIVPVNQERLKLLRAVVARAGRRPPPLEAVLEAFIAPALRLQDEMAERRAAFQRLMGRMFAEPDERLRSIFKDQFAEVGFSFYAALGKALPKLPPAELGWRLQFTIGAMAHTLLGARLLSPIAGERGAAPDAEGTIRRLVSFVAAGLRGPVRAANPARSSKV